MPTTYYEIWNQVRAEIGDYFPSDLAKVYCQRSMREISDRKRWSWLIASGQLVVPEQIGGTATLLANGDMTLLADAALTIALDNSGSPMLGRRQLRIGVGGGNIYEIRSWDSSSQTITLDQQIPLDPADYQVTIFRAYFLPPNVEQGLAITPQESSNFKKFLVVRDLSNNFPLILDRSSMWLDKRDPRRDASGTATHLVQSFPTTTRLPGSGSDPGQIPPGTPRFELWPSQVGPTTYQALYQLAYWPLEDNTTSTLPETLNPDLLLHTAMFKAYKWVMAQRTTPPNQRVAMRDSLKVCAEERDRLFLEAYREDEAYYAQRQTDLLGGKFPYVMGAAYAQVHDINLMTGLFND
jgi:hypothetical protein